jgi:hypothetical protein
MSIGRNAFTGRWERNTGFRYLSGVGIPVIGTTFRETECSRRLAAVSRDQIWSDAR